MKANTSTPVGATCGRPPLLQQLFLKILQLFSKNAELFAKKYVYIGERRNFTQPIDKCQKMLYDCISTIIQDKEGCKRERIDTQAFGLRAAAAKIPP
jgi:hypothetical protein